MPAPGVPGLPPSEAATIGCAEFHEEGNDYGTIEAGKRADMILLDADPTKDIRNTRSLNRVFLGDAMLDREALDTGLGRVKAFYASLPY